MQVKTSVVDTHCHLNFEVFQGVVTPVVTRALQSGVEQMVVVGTTLQNSQRAVEIATKHSGVHAAVGLHPHKSFSYLERFPEIMISGSVDPVLAVMVEEVETALRRLLLQPEVVAVGEIGFDRWQYHQTRHTNYQVTPVFLEVQSVLFDLQLSLAEEYSKSVIFHNRLAGSDLLAHLRGYERFLSRNAVFHCCEADELLLEYAQEHHIFIGVAGDVMHNPEKQEFVKKVPLELLVLETDAPFFHPFQDKDESNEPSNILKIAQLIASLKDISIEELAMITSMNAVRLYGWT